MRNEFKTDLEIKLFNYLKNNPKVITDSFGYMAYDKNNWILDDISIEDDNCFECRVFLFPGWLSPAVSVLPIPKNFIRREKLLKIKI